MESGVRRSWELGTCQGNARLLVLLASSSLRRRRLLRRHRLLLLLLRRRRRHRMGHTHKERKREMKCRAPAAAAAACLPACLLSAASILGRRRLARSLRRRRRANLCLEHGTGKSSLYPPLFPHSSTLLGRTILCWHLDEEEEDSWSLGQAWREMQIAEAAQAGAQNSLLERDLACTMLGTATRL